MRPWAAAGLSAVFLFPASAALAADPGDTLALLNRTITAAQKLNYAGTFVYQSGGAVETSRIAHVVDAGREFERLEVLDGSPREVVRNDNEVRCYLPARKLVLVERREGRRGFPALLPASVANLTENYALRKGSMGRVAGIDAQIVHLEPRDEFRYGHQLWMDPASGLLLKAIMLGEKGDALESFAFTQVQIGGSIDRSLLRSRYEGQGGDWKVQDPKATESRPDEAGWTFRNPPPGFRKVAGLKRSAGGEQPETAHVLFSDGLAAISVFIEPLGQRAADKVETGTSRVGAVGVYQRVSGDHLVVVLGEVPPAALKRIGDSVERRR